MLVGPFSDRLDWVLFHGQFSGVNERMEVILLPPMTVLAFHPVRTAGFFQGLDVLINFPMRTFFSLIVKLNGISPKILDIMRVDTERPIMVSRVRAPHSFVFVQVKFNSSFHLAD